MIRSFFSIPFLRIGQSSRMWFTPEDIADVLGLSKQAVKKTAQKKGFDIARLHQYKSRYFKSDGAPLDNKLARHDRFGLDLLMHLIYKHNSEVGIDIRDWMTAQISNLCLDGFTSLYNYNLDIVYRRAIASYVCESDSYTDIVKDRYGKKLRKRGMECFAEKKWTIEDLANPDYYVNRVEITTVRALDLAIHLLSVYLPVPKTHEEIFVLLGLDVKKGSYTDTQKENLIQWLSEKEKE